MSNRPWVWVLAYGYEGAMPPLPARPITPATNGALALVPPMIIQPATPRKGTVSYTATPVFGSATADSSAVLRIGHCRSRCHAGLATNAEQPLPAPLHASSVQPRDPGPWCSRLVPPTAISLERRAGNWGVPKPSATEDTVIATPGWS